MTTSSRTTIGGQGRSAKTTEACARLRAMAHRLGPGAKMPTVQELRQEIGVSLGTLNTALRESEEKNILTRRHSVGIYVSPTLRKNVPLVCNPVFFRSANHSPFWDILLDQVPHHGTQGMDVACHFAATTGGATALPPGLADQSAQGQIDGIMGIGLDKSTAVGIMAQGIPLVQMFGPGHVIILPDTKRMIDMAVTTLAEQGCRRVAMWSLDNVHPALEGTLREHGLSYDPELMRATQNSPLTSDVYASLSLPEQGYRFAMDMFCDPHHTRPDGLFISDDTMARGALIALKKLGIGIGTDVKIVSHANKDTPTLLGHEGELMLTEYDPSQFVSALFGQMAGLLTLPSPPPEQVVLMPPRLRLS